MTNNNNNNHNNNTESKKIERAAAIREQVAKQMTAAAAAAAAVVSPNTIFMYVYNRNDTAPATLFVTAWSRCLLALAKIILQSSNIKHTVVYQSTWYIPCLLTYLPVNVRGEISKLSLSVTALAS
jgi:hypothetical protein